MVFFSYFLLFFLFLLSFVSPVHAVAPVEVKPLYLTDAERAYLQSLDIVRAREAGWMPFSFRGDTDEGVGIAEDYWRLVRDKLGLQERLTPLLSFSEVLEWIRLGKADVYPSTTRTPEREQYAVFSKAFEHYPVAVATRRSTPFLTHTDVLEGKQVAVGADYSAYYLLKARYPAIQFVQVQDTRAALALLENGEVFAAVDILPVLQYQIEQFASEQIRLSGVSAVYFELQIMLRKELAALLPLLNRAIDSISMQERLDIHQKWLLRDVITATDYRKFRVTLGVALLVIVLVLYWNRQLARSKRQLWQTQQRYASLVNAMSEGVITHDASGRIVTCNAAAARLLGRHCDAVLGTHSGDRLWQVVHEDGSAWLGDEHPAMQTLRTGQAQHDVVLGVYAPDGRLRWLQVNSVPLYEKSKQSPSGVVVTFSDITERRMTQQQLDTANARRQAIFANTNTIIAILKDRHLLDANEYLAKVFGYRLEEILGQSTRLFYWDEAHYEDFYQQVQVQFADKGHCDIEYSFRHRKGHKVWLYLSISRLQTAESNDEVAAVGVDISERRRMELALRKERAKAQSYLDTVQTMMVALDSQGRITMINRAGADLLGYTEAELLGRNWFTTCLPQPEGYEKIYSVFRQMMQDSLEAAKYFENAVLCRDGRSCLIAWHNAYLSDETGKTIGVLCSGEDITERKAHELALQEALDKLDQERSRLRILIDTIPDLIWYKDTEGRYLGCNTRFEAFFGSAEADILGKTDYDFVSQTQAEFFRHHDRLAIKADAPRVNEEVIVFACDGHEEYVETTKVPMRDRHGRVFGILGIGHNITTRKQTEAALTHAREAADAANRAKTAFLANMSHELRTPLNVVLGYAQVLQRDRSLAAQQKDNVNKIKRSGDYLLTLINDVLDLAKIEAGRLELNPTPCYLPQFFAELSDIFKLRAQDKQLEFFYQASSYLPDWVTLDEKRLRQLCMNLLGNAVKFTEVGEIRLVVDYQQSELRLQFIDTGIGIDAAVQEKIFKPFAQVGDDQYKQQGTGLGLSICYSLIEHMRGRIEVHSEIGIGTRFNVTLPAEKVDKNHTAPTNQVATSGGSGSRDIMAYQRLDNCTGAFQILIVDDSPMNRTVLKSLLIPLGFLITEAEDGQEALDLTLKQSFDVILMDLVMPIVDGLKATREILSRAGLQNTLIIALSARAFDEDQQESLAAGCCAHLSKPLNHAQLLQTLQTHLPLTWRYQATPSFATPALPADSTPKTLSAAWLTQLETALVRGDQAAALTLLQPFHALCWFEALQSWIKNYEYERVLAWIEQHRGGQ